MGQISCRGEMSQHGGFQTGPPLQNCRKSSDVCVKYIPVDIV